MTDAADDVEGGLPVGREDGLAVFDIAVDVLDEETWKMLVFVPKVSTERCNGDHGTVDLSVEAPV